MGFYDYAEKYSLQQDSLKLKILLKPDVMYPTLTLVDERMKFIVPELHYDEESIEYLNYRFPYSDDGKSRVCRLYRAMVSHNSAHALYPLPRLIDSKSLVANFSETVINDIYIQSRIEASHQERIVDLAYAVSLATSTLKPLNRIYIKSTRIMTAILVKIFGGRPLDYLEENERAFVDEIYVKLCELKSNISRSISGNKVDVEKLKSHAEWLHKQLKEHGPYVETPSFLYTENATPCSVYSTSDVCDDETITPFFRDALQAFGQGLPSDRKTSSFWKKSDEMEGVQVFSNSQIEREKENKILGKLKVALEHTKFKSIEIPPQDHSEYLHVKDMVGGSSRRLLSNIMMASNLEFEDIRKKYGILDLSDAVQVVASKSDRNDVFMRDELLKQSFSLAVLIDVSRSMGVSPVENRARAVCLANVAASFVTDSTSCVIYAFSDKLYVLKDSSETFSKTVRSRIGGVPFDGATYMPDAIKAAAEFLKKSLEEQRMMLILSDGFPYGYSEIYEELSDTNEKIETAGMIMLGIGLGTEKMSDLFRYNASVYTQKDLIKKVARLFVRASMQELGS
jgi:hypothetical protein